MYIKVMKYFLVAIILLAIYLNRSYAYFYNSPKSQTQTSLPQTSKTENLNKQTIKFTTLGDSLLAGVGSSNYQFNLAYLVSQKLASGDKKVELSNLAYPGAKSKDLITSQLPQAIAEKPDQVLILIGINDVHDLISQNEFNSNYQQIINQLTNKTSAKITVVNIPFLGSNKILLPPWNFFIDLKTSQFNKIIKNIAKEKNLKLINLYSFTKKNFVNSSDLYSSDQFHPSDKGYLLFSELINAN